MDKYHVEELDAIRLWVKTKASRAPRRKVTFDEFEEWNEDVQPVINQM